MKESEESQAARRRKKILERGSDRMTFITHRIQSLDDRSPDPDSSSSAARFSRTQSVPVSVTEADRFSECGSDEISRLPFNYGLTDGVRDRMNSLQVIEATAKGEEDSVAPFYSEVKEPTADDPRISKASNKTLMFPKFVCNQLSSYFTPKDINSCVISSENTRLFCSIMMAILVVIAYANLPQHVVRSKSITASRPLYVLLVTDFIIVILQQCFTKQNATKVEVEKPESRQEDGSNWDEAVRVLEWGLVLYQTVRAIFIDCSFFTVIVVCGFSLI